MLRNIIIGAGNLIFLLLIAGSIGVGLASWSPKPLAPIVAAVVIFVSLVMLNDWNRSHYF